MQSASSAKHIGILFKKSLVLHTGIIFIYDLLLNLQRLLGLNGLFVFFNRDIILAVILVIVFRVWIVLLHA
jgi:hypothetical protein